MRHVQDTDGYDPALMRVLFVCLHNAGRSQMSAALWARAGHEAHPEVIEAMTELGIDLSQRKPQKADPGARNSG